MRSVADIPINQQLGMSYDNNTKLLSLPESEVIKNHFGQVSFCAQFTLAESASAQYLFEKLDMKLDRDLPTLRNATTKFHKPTHGNSYCQLVSTQHSKEEFQNQLNLKGKILTTVKVEVVSENGIKALTGSFHWLVLRRP